MIHKEALARIAFTWLALALGSAFVSWLYEPTVVIEMEPAIIIADQCVEDIDD